MYRFCIAMTVTVCMQAPAFASDWVEDGDAAGGMGGRPIQGQEQQPMQAPMQAPMMQGQPMMQGGQPGMGAMQQGLPGQKWKKPKKSLLKRLSGDDDDDDDDTIFCGMGFPATSGLRSTQTYSMPFASGTVTTEEEGFGAPMFAGTEVPVPTYSFGGGMPMVGTQYMGVPGMPGQVLGAPLAVPYGGGIYGGGMPYGGIYGGGYPGFGGYGGYGYGGSPLGYAVGGLVNRFAGRRNVFGYGSGYGYGNGYGGYPYGAGYGGGFPGPAGIGPYGNPVGGTLSFPHK